MKNVFRKVWGYVAILLVVTAGLAWATEFIPDLGVRNLKVSKTATVKDLTVTGTTTLATVGGGAITGTSLDINGNGDVSEGCLLNSGTVNEDSAIYWNNGTPAIFIEGSNGYVGLNDITPSVPLDVTGAGAVSTTFTAGTGITTTTGSVTGPNINATATFTYKDITTDPVQDGKSNTISATVTSGATTTAVDGSTLLVGASTLDAGEAVTVTCYGTADGVTGQETIGLWAGGTELGTITTGLASTGGWTASFRVGEYTDTAHQQVTGAVVIAGGTVASYHLTPASKTINMTQVHTLTVKIATPTHVADEITLHACDWDIRQ